MYNHVNSSDSQLNKVMSNDQFNQIVDAILSGKYSWACLLILRFSGYNPLHYIPYRTYNRLMKTNRDQTTPTLKSKKQQAKSKATLEEKSSHKLQDLHYLEELDHQSAKVKGGCKKLSLGQLSYFLAS